MFLKFPDVFLPAMREKILSKAADLFLTVGFKSVTMDDIAENLGCSKKTIYQHFENKTKLVEASTMFMFGVISQGIDHICALEKNPIEEIFDIKSFVMHHLKNEKSSPQHQLKKYYPKIYQTLKEKQFEMMHECVRDNLNRGIAKGIYRDSIHVDFISRIYFNSMMVMKDKELFPLTYFSMNDLMENYIDYHLHGICTSEGLEFLNQFKKSTEWQVN